MRGVIASARWPGSAPWSASANCWRWRRASCRRPGMTPVDNGPGRRSLSFTGHDGKGYAARKTPDGDAGVAVAGGLSVVIRRVFTRGAHAKRLAPTAHCRAPRSERYVRRLAAEPETQFLI